MSDRHRIGGGSETVQRQTSPRYGGALKTATIRLIANPKAGGLHGSKKVQRLVDLLAAHGVDVEAMPDTDPAAAACAAVRDGASVVVAAGGDGTVSSVASALVGSDTTLGVLPVGTLNHFAKDLGLPMQLDAAAGVIANGNVRRVDVGEVNGRVFINNSSLGIYPRIVMWRDQQRKFGHGRWMALMQAIIAAFRRLPFVELKLTAGDIQIARVTPLIFIGNNEYELEGRRAGSRQRLDGGHLFVCIANAYSGMGLIRLSMNALFGRLGRTHEFETLCAPEALIEIAGRRQIRVAFDGEVGSMEPPLRYRIRPGALRVLAP